MKLKLSAPVILDLVHRQLQLDGAPEPPEIRLHLNTHREGLSGPGSTSDWCEGLTQQTSSASLRKSPLPARPSTCCTFERQTSGVQLSCGSGAGSDGLLCLGRWRPARRQNLLQPVNILVIYGVIFFNSLKIPLLKMLIVLMLLKMLEFCSTSSTFLVFANFGEFLNLWRGSDFLSKEQ